MERDRIFISYSHHDKKWLAEVKKHLSVLVHNHQFIIWDDSKIKTGSDWKNEIKQSINRCRVAILLVSNNFLASEFIAKKELPGILKATRNDQVVVFNVILDTCAFRLTGLEPFQCLNNPDHPLEELKPGERKRELVKLTSQLLEVINKNNGISDPVIANPPEFSKILVLADLVKSGGRTITEIQNSTSIKRKNIVAALDQLLGQQYIQKEQGIYNKKPSIIWKASSLGDNIFTQFENAYSSIVCSS